MSFNKKQLIVGIAGLASATSIGYFTIQSGSSELISNYFPTTNLQNNSVLVSQKPSPVIITPPTSGCKVSMAIVDDPAPPLNVRRSPEVQEGNIVGELHNNTFISVADEQSGWLQITNPVKGWVTKNRTRSSCAMVDKTITFSPESDKAVVKGEIIGSGSHNYRVRMIQGQTLTINNLGDVFPAIISPDGLLMSRESNVEGNENKWTNIMAVSGVYTLQLDSYLRGFEYEFLVRIEGEESL